MKGREHTGSLQAPVRGLGEGVWGRPHICSSRRWFGSKGGELAGLDLWASWRPCSTWRSWASGSSVAGGRHRMRAEQAGPHPLAPVLKA